jgi:hypothetical protein
MESAQCGACIPEFSSNTKELSKERKQKTVSRN